MTARFYDELAPYYHLLYGDWNEAIGRQGAALSALLGEEGVEPGAPVLDAACGIGTQSLGLARHGYQLTASDISAGAVLRLKDELSLRRLVATVQVDDLKSLALVDPGSMAAVLACDNSIPHLLADEDILQAFRSCLRCLRPGGALVVSVRDYEVIERRNPDVRPYGLRQDVDGNRILAVQVWEWDGDRYGVRLYLTTEFPDGSCQTKLFLSRYYAVSIQRLIELMEEAGFTKVRRRDDVLFQPVLVARRRKA